MRRTFTWILGSYLFFMGVSFTVAVSADNPYVKIVDRNVFSLKAPVPPPSPESLKPPPPKITLTGITTILGIKRVLMKVPMPARPPEPAREESLMLTEGERSGDIEVLEINEKTGTVKISNFGTVMTLSLDKDALKPSGGGAAMPSLPGTVPTLPGAGQPGANPRGIPPRTLRLPGNPQAGSSQPELTPSGATVAISPRSTPVPANLMSPEEQAVILEANRAEALDRGDANAKIFPTTELTKELMGEGAEGL